MKRITSVSLLALALAGCVNMAPDHTRPALASAAAYDPAFAPDGTVTAATLSYGDWFTDPRLVALLDTAVANNRDLMAATARIEQARAQYRIQDSRRLPTAVASAAASRTRTPLGTLDSEATGAVTTDRFDVGVGVTSFELDFWGRVANLSDAARAQYLATEANQRAFYLSLIADVASTYFELRETEAQIDLAQATLDSRREGLRIAQLRLDAGVTSALPYRQAETLLTSAEQQLAAQQLAQAQLRNQLAVLVGGSIPTDLPGAMSLQSQGNAMVLDAGTPSELLLVRPDLVAAEEQLRAARANIGAARAAFFPTISLTGSAGFASSDLGDLFGSMAPPGPLDRPFRCPSSTGARAKPIWTSPRRAKSNRSRFTRKRSRPPFAKCPTGLPVGAGWPAGCRTGTGRGGTGTHRAPCTIALPRRRGGLSRSWMPSETCFLHSSNCSPPSAPICRTGPRCSLPSGAASRDRAKRRLSSKGPRKHPVPCRKS